MRTDQDIDNYGGDTFVQRAINNYRQYIPPSSRQESANYIYADMDSLVCC